jgi:saccharopine dehydrogenase-like NADP-dependent oxidoreductase
VLLEALEEHLPRSDQDLVLVRTWLDAGETRTTLEFEDVPRDGFSALARTTAFPATALIDLILTGKVAARGVATMNECAPPQALLTDLEQVGLHVRS